MPLVLELQSLAQDGKTDVVELIRRAKVVTVKLKLDPFGLQLDHELSGYSTPKGPIPKYRTVPCVLYWQNRFHPPQPVQFEERDEAYKHFSSVEFRQPLSEIGSLLAQSLAGKGRGTLSVMISPEEQVFLESWTEGRGGVHFHKRIQAASLQAMLDGVRNEVLRWSLDLEAAGVLGDGMTFSSDEKKAAKESPAINNYGVLIQGNDNAASVAQNSPNASVSTSKPRDVVGDLTSLASSLPPEQKELSSAIKLIAEVLKKDTKLAVTEREQIGVEVRTIAREALVPVSAREPALAKQAVYRLRELLSLGADVLQVWPVLVPMLARVLGIPL